MKKIAVLMTCYNRVNTTLACLRQLFAQDLPEGYSFCVWLVDDASPDKTGEKVKAMYPQVNVIQGTGSLFWCKGMRLAWDKAVEDYDYDYYLWLNDDAILKDGAVSSLLKDSEDTHSVVVGTFASDESYTDVSYGATRIPPTGAARVADKMMNGNLAIIPRSIYNKVGAICGKYHHQYGDYDYGNMLKAHGIDFYVSSEFSGICPQQPERYEGLEGKTIVKRLRLLYDPRGYDLHDTFWFKYRSKGFFSAVLSILHVIFIVVKGK